MFEKIKNYFKRERTEIPEYGLLYFDHLYAEFQLEKDKFTDSDRQICLDIQAKRGERILTWNEIYTFELVLLKYQDFETLKNKIISLRVKYRSIADTAEYGEYITLRSVDIATATNSDENIEKFRSDYKYLVDEFYLRYAYISTREKLRTRLLRYGGSLTLFFFLISTVFIVLTVISPAYRAFSAFSTLIAVVFAGIMGAFVSMQQRLQNVPQGGDPVYNLSLLTHGWLSIFLSPISGAIFAALLFLFFAGGLLEGTIFPRMEAPQNSENSPSIVALTNFILGTAPQTGKDFALLLIWSFIAGFAERFVPDTLMRLVNQKKTGEAAGT